jgi:hypothetical protein
LSTRLTVAAETPVRSDCLAGQALAAQRLEVIDCGPGCWLPQMIGM